MIRLHKDLTHPVFQKVNPYILIGRDGRMFYLGNEMVRQSAGLVLQGPAGRRGGAILTSMRDALAKRGIGFLVTSPPNSSTIYQDDLPVWAQKNGRKTEYDLFLEELKARGVKTVDLRPVLADVRKTGEAYLLYDAHWTPRGALAGVQRGRRSGRPPDMADRSGDRARTAGGAKGRRRGAHHGGAGRSRRNGRAVVVLEATGTDEAISSGVMPDHVVTTGRPGPTVMVIGDSFTAGYFPLMLSEHVGRAIWMHHHQCGFDWKLIDRSPSGRGLVGADRAIPGVRSGRAADRFPGLSADDRVVASPPAVKGHVEPPSPVFRAPRAPCDRGAAHCRSRRARQSGDRAEGGAAARACAGPARDRGGLARACRPSSTPISRTISACGRR